MMASGAGVFFAVWYAGPILAALHDVVPPHRRALATGAYLLAVHLLDVRAQETLQMLRDHPQPVFRGIG